MERRFRYGIAFFYANYLYEIINFIPIYKNKYTYK